eukprot:gnl/MRDRNA2_/MRDRNA2_62107_c0_seq1.p1 gnl/MRDRNA2_/MRDRNA2_62107_c0~~gnl/MRDRNA2_/MRDRNA2_62107_c0_seq1.p1  ORF type:complete len:1219 (+),score=304.54 gnl/MRDRNA2_/MRDRNA2_62107_c0_seq1:75-3731(+)
MTGSVDDQKQSVKDIFRVYDKNHDGFIDREELQHIFRLLSKDWSVEEFDVMFKAVDQNGDGKISYDEFVDWVFQDYQTSGPEVVEKMKEVFNMSTNGLQCTSGHVLTHFSPEIDGWCCEECGSDLQIGSAALQCHPCNGITWCPSCAIHLSVQCPSILPDNGQTSLLRHISRGRDYFLVGLMEIEDLVRDDEQHEQLDQRRLSIQTLQRVILDLLERLEASFCWSSNVHETFQQLRQLIDPEQFNEICLSTILEMRTKIGHSSVWEQLASLQEDKEDTVEDSKGIANEVRTESTNKDAEEFEDACRLTSAQRAKVLARQRCAKAKLLKLFADLNQDPEPAALAELPEMKKIELRRESNVRRLLVEANAVPEMEALLGTQSSAGLKQSAKLFLAVDNDDSDGVMASINEGADILQRDSLGNLPVHKARSLTVAKILANLDPRTLEVKNLHGETPLQTFVKRQPNDQGSVEVLGGKDVALLLELDDEGVSACMRLSDDAREDAQRGFSSWQEVEVALRDAHAPLDRLKATEKLKPEGMWPQILAFHLFGEPEAWNMGNHTSQSRQRSLFVWKTMSALLEMVADTAGPDREQARDGASALLHATRGPMSMQDAREPYREQLSEVQWRIQCGSFRTLEKLHIGFDRNEAHESIRSLKSGLSPEIAPDLSTCLGVRQYLRMDFAMRPNKSSDLTVPSWVQEPRPDPKEVLDSLKQVGAVAPDKGLEWLGTRDQTYQFLLHGMAEQDLAEEDTAHDAQIAWWYAAWLYGVCQRNQEVIKDTVSKVLNGIDGAVYARKHAKSKTRICEKTGGYIKDNVEVLKKLDVGQSVATKQYLTQSAALIVDINGCTFVAASPDALHDAYLKLSGNNGLGVLQVNNLYSRAIRSCVTKGGYRDLKVWCPVQCPYGPLVTEIILLYQGANDEKRWMHMPYEYFRGSFDSPDLKVLLSEAKEKAREAAKKPAADEVNALQENLKILMVRVEEKKAEIAVLTEETDKASAGAAAAKEKANAVEALKLQAEQEMAEAMPAMSAAKAVFDWLDKKSIVYLNKQISANGPAEVVEVCSAAAFLLRNEKQKLDWKGAQKLLNSPKAFLSEIHNLSAEEIPDEAVAKTEAIIAQPHFNYEYMKTKAPAAAYLTQWVQNIVKYNKIHKKVAPLMEKFKTATAFLEHALDSQKQDSANAAFAQELDAKLKAAIDEKEAAEAQAESCLEELSLAECFLAALEA